MIPSQDEIDRKLAEAKAKIASGSDPHAAARALRAAVRALAASIIKAHRALWPSDQDGSYTVIQRNGKTKVEFHPPQEKEPGWVDA